MSVEQEELIKQIQEWSEEKEYHKIAATIEMLPEEDRMPELTSLLADACERRCSGSGILSETGVHTPG